MGHGATWRGTAALTAGIAGLLAAGAATAITPATLVGPSLEPQSVSVSTLRDGVLVYFDSDRQLQRQPIERFVLLRPTPAKAEPVAESTATLILVDGQRLAGRFAGQADDGAAVRWESDVLGRVSVSLEDLAELHRAVPADSAAGEPWPRDGRDRLLLVNGDRLAGFISAATDDGLLMMPEGASDTVAIPFDRLARVVLANPTRTPPRELHTVAFAGGTILSVAELRIEDDRLGFDTLLRPPARATTPLHWQPLIEVAQIDFTGSGYRVVNLLERPWRIEESAEVFGLTIPPRLVDDGRAMRLHAPARVVFDLPADATRVSARGELAVDEDVPAVMAEWADFEVILRWGGEGERRFRINARQHEARINVAVEGEVLRVELDPALNGPVLDRLRLSEAMVLTRSPSPGASSRATEP